MNFKEELMDEMKYLNRDDKIKIRDIIIDYFTRDVIIKSKNGLKIQLELVPEECLNLIKEYIEKEYEDLHEYRKNYCEYPQGKPFKFGMNN